MAQVTLADLVAVPNKFTDYTLQRISDKLTLVRRGVAAGSPLLRQLINGTPRGGRFIQMPYVKPLTGQDYVFGEGEQNNREASGIQTGSAIASLQIRWHMWSKTDLSYILGGYDPFDAVSGLVADWWAQREQEIYLSILKGVLAGPISNHVNDVVLSGDPLISVSNTIDTKQVLGDNASTLGMIFMHSATYSKLQKNQDIENEYDSDLKVNIPYYLGYEVVVDDNLPRYTFELVESGTEGAIAVTPENIAQYRQLCASPLIAGASYVRELAAPIYDTYFLGKGALAREDGALQGLVLAETARDNILADDVLIYRRCMVVHPNGFSWNVPNGNYPSSNQALPDNNDLADPDRWTLAVDHKQVPIACLRHIV